MLQQTHTTSNKGLQSFIDSSPEYELAPTGIASMHEQAQKLAEYGRNGDIYVVHAAEGETVVPMEVLNENPKIKELLFKQMEEMGLDPQEFVVGNELNSINPDTGLPEFFLKRIFRTVKRAVKSVVKIIKKAAPIVLPIAAAAFGVPFLGPAFGAGTFGASFLGSGLGSLIGGASIKDSLKAGLISGGIAGLTAGFTGQGSFGENLTSNFTGATPVFDVSGAQVGTQYAASPFADAFGSSAARQASAAASKAQFGNLFSGDPFSAFTGKGQLFGDTPTGVTDSSGALKPGFTFEGATAPTAPSLSSNAAAIQRGVEGARAAGTPPGSYQIAQATGSGQPLVGPPVSSNVASASAAAPNPALAIGKKLDALSPEGVFRATQGPNTVLGYDIGKAIDYTPLGPNFTAADVLKQAGITTEKALQIGEPAMKTLTATAADIAAKASPGMAQKYGPSLALGTGAAYLGGAFDPPPDDNPDRDDLEGFVPSETGYDLFQKDPQKYLIQDMNPYRYDPGNPYIPTRYASVADGGYMEKPQSMNMGGTPQFPRREMLVEGPGTERSDDIPAMLSDGEFVMNARSVRGADPSGNGNRQAGAANLYNMMRNFEMRT